MANPNANHSNNMYLRYAVSADGRNFLMSQPGGGATAASGGLADQIAAAADRVGATGTHTAGSILVLNWPQLLKKK